MNGLEFLEESSGQGRGFQDWSFIINEEKEHVALAYNNNDGLISIMTWNDFDELASYWSTDAGDWLGLADAAPNTICSDGVNTYIKIR